MNGMVARDRIPAPPAPVEAPQPDAYEVEAGSSEMHPIREYVALLRRHWLVVLGVTVVVAGAGLYQLVRMLPVYQATATVRLTDVRRAMTGEMGMAYGQQQLSMYTDPLLSEIQVLRSQELARGVARRAGLRLRPADASIPQGLVADPSVAESAPRQTVNLMFGEKTYDAAAAGRHARAAYGAPVELGGIRFAIRSRPQAGTGQLEVVSLDDAAAQVLGSLVSVPRENTDVVDIRFKAGDPQLAQRVTNAAALEFQAMNAGSAQRESRRRRMFLEEQLHATDSTLLTAQAALSAFRSRERLYSSREKFTAEQTGLIGLDNRRGDLVAERSLYQTLLGRLERAAAGGDGGVRALAAAPGIADNPALARLLEQLSSYQARRDSMTAGAYGASENDPDVRALDGLLATTRSRLVASVRDQIAVLDARVAAIDQQRGNESAQLSQLPAAETEEVRLVEQVESTRNLANQLREQYQKARVDEAVEMGQVTILDPASAPTTPLGRGRRTKLVFFVLVGLALGSGLAHLLERINATISKREEIEPLLRVPVLATVPRLRERKRVRGLRRWAARVRSSEDERAELVTVTQPDKPGAEAYRMLRTSLLFSQFGAQLRTLVVTSAAQGEGKSTTSSNLAVTYAQHGLRVLLVDCDLRRAQQHEAFGMKRTPGLSDLVLGYSSRDEAIRQGPVEGLHILPAGTAPPNASEVASSMRLRNTLRELGAEYDLMILDTPPLMATAEAAVLAKMADGMIMVLRAGRTHRGAAQQVVHHMRSLGVRLLGAVLNDPDERAISHDGYYGYYGYYGY
ncbi:MAG TPA: polysaccharide biosynthesis tyrosine autokinase, partial [Longimicrobiaceae bacterium]